MKDYVWHFPSVTPFAAYVKKKRQKMVLTETAAPAITRCERDKEKGLVSLPKSTLTSTTPLCLKIPARTFTLAASSGPLPAVPAGYC